MGSQIGKEHDKLNHRILEVALSLFNEYGIENVSMHKIAKTAEIGQGTLYRRYINKSHLCMALMEDRFNRCMLEIKEYLINKKKQPVHERLRYLIVQLHLTIGEHLDWMRMLTISGTLEETSKDMYNSPFYTSIQEMIYALLEEAKNKGETSIKDIELSSFMLASSMAPELMFHLHKKGYSFKEIAENVAEIQLNPLFIQKKEG
ncbi:TetR/AcrR family transcriptional regulator [Priestia endophytica]|uniref:TetR/AcrR family transcriptional regulator n=1 Tax=Priestia endophytica TaxID=135735 RepID=UPI003D29189B